MDRPGTRLEIGASRPGVEGLSIIGRNQTSSKTLGLHLHLTLAVSGAGLPLGVLRCGFDERPAGEESNAQGSGDGDVEQAAKEDTAPVPGASGHVNKMQRWLDGLRDVAQAASQLSAKTRVISVMDPERRTASSYSTSSAGWAGSRGWCAPSTTGVLARAPRSCLRQCATPFPTGTSRSRSGV